MRLRGVGSGYGTWKDGRRHQKERQEMERLARDAVKEGGSSDKNLKAFVQDVGEGCF
ncbi:hypothetical protein BDE02_02G212100 [Populus trichocarpa]|nr:hypothetical protein BDE02_02G212100 [Populus trichocarpa]